MKGGKRKGSGRKRDGIFEKLQIMTIIFHYFK